MISTLTRSTREPLIGTRVLVRLAVLLIEPGSDLFGPRVEYAGIGFSVEKRDITHTIQRLYAHSADRTKAYHLVAIETRATIIERIGRVGYLVAIGCAEIPVHAQFVRALESEGCDEMALD